jgi:mono/diheme cytochrome c family protein
MSDNTEPTEPRRRKPEKVPPALRPGETDDVLEGPRLTRVSTAGLIMSILLAALIFLYWVHEPTRMVNTANSFAANQVLRGQQDFSLTADPVTGLPNTRGIGCARCHGGNLAAATPIDGNNADGGKNVYINSLTGKQATATVPALHCVFYRYSNPANIPSGYVAMYPSALAYITATIQHGRTNSVLGDGDDMPTWSQDYGGPLTDQQIDDIVAYLGSIQYSIKQCKANPQL